MEAIRNYLETMFLQLPNTPEVLKAKQELFSMMEDKYQALLEEGKPDGEAAATVIAEFGNLQELASELGIEDVIRRHEPQSGRNVSVEEAEAYLKENGRNAFLHGCAVFLFIVSACPLIFFSEIGEYEEHFEDMLTAVGLILLFGMIAAGVGILIISDARMERWEYLKRERCFIDYEALGAINDRYVAYQGVGVIRLSVGIGLCIMSVLPPAVLGICEIDFLAEISVVFMLLAVGIGVWLIVFSSMTKSGYTRLLKLNAAGTIGANYYESQRAMPHYENRTLASVMNVYWQSVLCLYLCWSFLTFDWHMTWIIWPVAGIIHGLLKNLFGKETRQ